MLSEGVTTPQQLLFDCTASAKTAPWLMAHCRGLVEGVWQTDALFPSRRISAPPGVTIGQAVSVVVAFLRKNPASIWSKEAKGLTRKSERTPLEKASMEQFGAETQDGVEYVWALKGKGPFSFVGKLNPSPADTPDDTPDETD